MDFLAMCADLGVCDLVPSNWHWVMPPVMFLLFVLIAGIPIARILRRAGRSRWWVVLAFVPLVNLLGLWLFAFVRWPNLDRSPG